MHVCHLDYVIRRWFIVLLYTIVSLASSQIVYGFSDLFTKMSLSMSLIIFGVFPQFPLSRRSLLYGVQLLPTARL